MQSQDVDHQNLSGVILRIHPLLGLLQPQKRSEVTARSSPVVRSLALQAATPSSSSVWAALPVVTFEFSQLFRVFEGKSREKQEERDREEGKQNESDFIHKKEIQLPPLPSNII